MVADDFFEQAGARDELKCIIVLDFFSRNLNRAEKECVMCVTEVVEGLAARKQIGGTLRVALWGIRPPDIAFNSCAGYLCGVASILDALEKPPSLPPLRIRG